MDTCWYVNIWFLNIEDLSDTWFLLIWILDIMLMNDFPSFFLGGGGTKGEKDVLLILDSGTMSTYFSCVDANNLFDYFVMWDVLISSYEYFLFLMILFII